MGSLEASSTCHGQRGFLHPHPLDLLQPLLILSQLGHEGLVPEPSLMQLVAVFSRAIPRHQHLLMDPAIQLCRTGGGAQLVSPTWHSPPFPPKGVPNSRPSLLDLVGAGRKGWKIFPSTAFMCVWSRWGKQLKLFPRGQKMDGRVPRMHHPSVPLSSGQPSQLHIRPKSQGMTPELVSLLLSMAKSTFQNKSSNLI